MIGILDSGMGGLTVASALKSLPAGYDMIYFGDTAHAPYGGRSPEKIVQCADRALQFLVQQGVTLVVVACSTISSLAGDHFHRNGSLPVVDAVDSTVSAAVAAAGPAAKIGVMGTLGTVMSLAHERAVKKSLPLATVYNAAAPLLVPMIEAGWLKRPETTMAVKKYLHPLKTRQIDALILGCNHYAVIQKIIQRKIGKRVHLVDSVSCLTHGVRQYLATHEDLDRELPRNGFCRYFFSDLTAEMERTAKRVFHCSGPLEKALLA